MPENPIANESAVNMTNEQASAPAAPKANSTLLEKVRAIRHRLPLAVRLPLAILFLAIGIIGGFIPVLQGWIFVLAAIWLMFPEHAEQLIDKIKIKLEKLREKS
jgi:hypothetical protein